MTKKTCGVSIPKETAYNQRKGFLILPCMLPDFSGPQSPRLLSEQLSWVSAKVPHYTHSIL